MQQKKLVIIAVVILLIAAVAYFFSQQSSQIKQTSTQQVVDQKDTSPNINNTVPSGTSILFFNPASSQGISGTTAIRVESGDKKITGVQLEISFDPKVIEHLEFSVPSDSVFGSEQDYIVLFDKVNYDAGTATYAIAINLGKEPVRGTGTVVHMNYQLKTATSTTVNLTQKSIVTELGNSSSVLREVSSFSISN